MNPFATRAALVARVAIAKERRRGAPAGRRRGNKVSPFEWQVPQRAARERNPIRERSPQVREEFRPDDLDDADDDDVSEDHDEPGHEQQGHDRRRARTRAIVLVPIHTGARPSETDAGDIARTPRRSSPKPSA